MKNHLLKIVLISIGSIAAQAQVGSSHQVLASTFCQSNRVMGQGGMAPPTLVKDCNQQGQTCRTQYDTSKNRTVYSGACVDESTKIISK